MTKTGIKCDRYFLHSERAFGSCEAGILTHIKMIKIFGLIYHRSLADSLTIVVDKDIPHDCEYPTLEIDVINVFVLIVECLEGGVLLFSSCVTQIAGYPLRDQPI